MAAAKTYIYVQMWGPDGEVVTDGLLMPESDCDFGFQGGPVLISRWALTRLGHDDAIALVEGREILQDFRQEGTSEHAIEGRHVRGRGRRRFPRRWIRGSRPRVGRRPPSSDPSGNGDARGGEAA